jgi:hypothetical protein
MQILDLEDEVGNVDRCEVDGTRVIRVIERIRFAPASDNTDGDFRHNQILYAHACGYRD